MENLFTVIFGLIATFLMSLFLKLMRGVNAPWAQEVYAIGSVVPKPAWGAGWPGMFVYLASALVGAFAYISLGTQGDYTVATLLGFGVVAGVIRGGVCSMLLALLAAEQGPFLRFVQAGPGPGITHFAGNVLFGLIVSLLFGLSGVLPGLAF